MMDLFEVARATNGTAYGSNVLFGGVSTDSRSVGRGELFVALRGERFDGHEYLAQASERGACAAVVAGIRRGLLDSPVRVATRGGDLTIAWAGPGTPVLMTGPAVTVFEGDIEIPEETR